MTRGPFPPPGAAYNGASLSRGAWCCTTWGEDVGHDTNLTPQAAAGGGPDFGALVPTSATVAALWGEVVELGSPAGAIAEINRDY